MTSFLEEVAKDIVLKFKDFKNVILILPGKRSGIFLKNEILKINTHTTYAPEIYSIEEFVELLSGLKPAEHIQLLFELYEVYKKETPPENTDPFQHFSRWAQIVLQDFSEIDQYLVDHNQLFSYLSSLKEINHWYVQKEKTTLQKNYIKFWNSLKSYYISFKERLLQKQMAYQGLLYSQACKNIGKYLGENPEKHHVFIGFNALTRSEEHLIREFLELPNNHILWDTDSAFLADKDHDAGLFIRTYKKEWPCFKDREFKFISNHFKDKKNIQITGIPKTVGQAKYVGKLVGDIHRTAGNMENTAVILGNESLLNPVLNALPKAIGPVNVTYGVPLHQAPVTTFFSALFRLTENSRQNTWYYKHVLHLLSHALTKKLLSHKGKDYTKAVMEGIRRENIVYVSSAYIKDRLHESLHGIGDYIFMNATQLHVNTVIEKCLSLIRHLKAKHRKNDIYLEYLYKFYRIFNRILHLNSTYNAISDIASLKRIYHELLRAETINFKGEPLSGLQLMGMLESRNLDFENVIITAVNEGVLPSGKKQASFLPFDVRIVFNLPTYKEKDAIYTYHFYRLLQRAKNIYLLYNTEPDALEGGEKSRFLLQLITRTEANHNLRETIASPKVSHPPKKAVEIRKNNDIIERLKKVAAKGFSPTSLSNYIRNPIDFYYHTVMNIKLEDDMEETITSRMLGIIIHGVLEELYKPLEGKLLGEADIAKMKKDMDGMISDNFSQVYKENQWRTGKNLISFNIVKRYIEHFLNLELGRIKQGKNITIIQLEKKLETSLNIPELDLNIILKGTIDRVEEVDGTIHITDYKTGKVIPSDIEITAWEELITDYRYHKAFQLLSYSYIYAKNYPLKKPAEAAVLSFKNLKSGYLSFARKEGPGRNAPKTTLINRDILTAYEDSLKSLILEIFDTGKPFVAKDISR